MNFNLFSNNYAYYVHDLNMKNWLCTTPLQAWGEQKWALNRITPQAFPWKFTREG